MCHLTGRATAAAPSPIRALHSLSPAQISRVHAALARMPLAWSAEEQEGYDGDLTLVLTPGDNTCPLSLALWRSPAGFHLLSVDHDEPADNLILPSLDAALARLAALTARTARLA
ncbi:hypothetical protein ACFQX4_26805 [Roseomonas sp. GCM10028921]